MMATKIQPQQVYQIVGLLPKDMQAEFSKEAYMEVTQPEGEFIPDAVKRYDHSLGLSWLTKHKIPNTVEELQAQRQFIFQTMISGSETYNVGQFIVLFPSIIYGSRDIGESVLLLEVMVDLEFPAMPDLVVPFNDEIRNAPYGEDLPIALRYALYDYVSTGKVKLHTAGMRMYGGVESYKFQDRFVEPTDRRSFKEILRDSRRS